LKSTEPYTAHEPRVDPHSCKNLEQRNHWDLTIKTRLILFLTLCGLNGDWSLVSRLRGPCHSHMTIRAPPDSTFVSRCYLDIDGQV